MNNEEQEIAATKSRAVCHAPIGACLARIEQEIGSSGVWTRQNDHQEVFFSEYYADNARLLLKLPEIESIVAKEAGTINRFLKERGFSIKLDEFSQDPPRFAAAAVLNLLLKWSNQGTVTTVRNGQFPAFRLSGAQVEFRTTLLSSTPLAIITTHTGDKVHIMATPRLPETASIFSLVKRRAANTSSSNEFGGLVLPMISYDSEQDLCWLKGAQTSDTDGVPWEIEQAVQQIKFRMNEVGARAESAAAVVVAKRGVAPQLPDLVIDDPFLLWITRPGVPDPLFIGHFTEEMWMRPEML